MHWSKRFFPQIVITLVSIAIFAPLIDFLPVFDGHVYYNCLLNGIEQPFSLWNFDCYNHPTMLYMLLLALPQYLLPNNIFALNGTLLILGIAAVFAFYSVIGKLYQADRLEKLLVSLILTVYPVAWAAAVNINPDYGCYVWSIIYLAALLYDKRMLIILCGVFLVLSKEPGVMAYIAITGAYFLIFLFEPKHDFAPKRLAAKIAKNWQLLVPAFAVVAYFVAKSTLTRPLLWSESSGGTSNSKLFGLLLSFDLSNKTLLAYLAIMMVMNFTWVITLITLAGGGFLAIRSLIGHPVRDATPGSNRSIWFTLIAAAISFYFLTRFMTFINARYFLIFYPLFLLLFVGVLRKLVLSSQVRYGIYSLIIGLNVLSLYRTADPLTRRIFGTFPFGNQELLNMTAYTHECCGLGRDQLLYNLEFTRMFIIQEKIFGSVNAAPGTQFVASNDYYTLARPYFFDPAANKLELSAAEGRFEINVRVAGWVSEAKPRDFYYLNFPNYDNDSAHRSFAAEYQLTEERTVHYGQYGMLLQRYQRKTT